MSDEQSIANMVDAAIAGFEALATPMEEPVELPFTSIKEYSEVTGKRFRVTAEQAKKIKSGEITREAAFEERCDELVAEWRASQSIS